MAYPLHEYPLGGTVNIGCFMAVRSGISAGRLRLEKDDDIDVGR